MTIRREGYRFTLIFIQRWTKILTIALCVGVAIGLLLGLLSDVKGTPRWLGDAGFVVILSSIGLPLLGAAILGGESIFRGGGLVGAGLILGFAGVVIGRTLQIDWMPWAGGILIVLSILGFWIMGWVAKVPMFFGVKRDDP
ncbi:putative membrane protein [Psychromicrobium silvestre]|uniref:Putative membrane protein n=1 Tax=Psychromicrobium silvestre TaxID=1645614 RepID=A0A7Y9LR50_9MICC|nr:hypothetical protein [Psychromicrobium silvestre]NYE94060.1 putative membrane protein [Psychromicrobium silvestre]